MNDYISSDVIPIKTFNMNAYCSPKLNPLAKQRIHDILSKVVLISFLTGRSPSDILSNPTNK